ncbi:hypothetical protein [Runella aurantiaca]|uniref:Uncharacterized protein n=1 Tax=Runella aurantiaca TaxID=2282308 RepID=A0A369I4Y8_9BACT|nr:hypothetical protein [Runella aurantiaca]RDB04648.1 hypothetical protein DVG78_16940 [Runella aurantiaca]
MSQRDLFSHFTSFSVQTLLNLLEFLHSDSMKQVIDEMGNFKVEFDPDTITPNDAEAYHNLLTISHRMLKVLADHPEMIAALPQGLYERYAKLHYELSPWGMLLEKVAKGELPTPDDRESEIIKAASRIRSRTLIAQKLYEGESA